jgi:hypothetical protein
MLTVRPDIFADGMGVEGKSFDLGGKMPIPGCGQRFPHDSGE